MAFVGLAKNTGKTEALVTLIEELSATGRRLGITSIGRDGEEFDAIQPRITKPPIRCPAGTLVATAAPLLRRSGASYVVLRHTGVRTPLGEVEIVRLEEPAKVEVAGPSSSEEIRAAVDEMLALGRRPGDHRRLDRPARRRRAGRGRCGDHGDRRGARRGHEGVVRDTGRAVEMISLPRGRR